MVKTVVILSVIYLLSVYGSWKEFRKAYKTRWDTLNPTAVDLFFVLMPVYNTAAVIVMKLTSPTDEKTIKFLNKLFK